MLCASFAVRSSIGKWFLQAFVVDIGYWEVVCASFVVHSSTKESRGFDNVTSRASLKLIEMDVTTYIQSVVK